MAITITNVTVDNDGLTWRGTLGGGTAPYSNTSGAGWAFGATLPWSGVVQTDRTTTTPTVSGTAISGTLSSAVAAGAKLTFTYNPATGNLTDGAAGAGTAYVAATMKNMSAVRLTPSGATEVSNSLLRVPVGEMTAYRARRALHASQNLPIATVGDSTTSAGGSGAEAIWVSWAYKLRRKFQLAGFTDGGIGSLRNPAGQNVDGNPGPADPIDVGQVELSRTGWAGSDDAGRWANGLSVWTTNTPGDVVEVQAAGCNRARIIYSLFNNQGTFTYAVDGGAESAPVVATRAGNPGWGYVDVPLGSVGTHRIKIKSAGGLPLLPVFASEAGAANDPASTLVGTYYYAITGLNASGETTISNKVTRVMPNNPRQYANLYVSPTTIFTSYNLYRASSINGPFELVANLVASTSQNVYFQDHGTTPNAAINPPLVSTAGTNTAAQAVSFGIDFDRSDAGITVNKVATYGSSFKGWGLVPGVAYLDFPYQIALGLTQVDGSVTHDTTPGARPVPVLGMVALGLNNLSANDGSLIGQATAKWVTACRGNGTTPIVIIPHYTRYGGLQTPENVASYTAAQKNVAEQMGAVWFSFDQALTNGGWGTAGPHLSDAGYEIEADSMWTNLLSTNEPAPADTTKPEVLVPTLAADGVTITVPLSEVVSGSTGFTTSVDGVTRTSAISGTGASRTLTLSAAAYPGQGVTLGYAPGDIADPAGNILLTFSSKAVTNNSTVPIPDTIPPTSTGIVAQTPTTSLVLTCSEPMSAAGTAASFVLKNDGVSTTASSTSLIDSTHIGLVFPTLAYQNQVLTLSHTGITTKDAAGNSMAAFTDAIVTNSSAIPKLTGGGATAQEIRIEMDANSTQLAEIKAKTNLIPAAPASADNVTAAKEAIILEIDALPTVAQVNEIISHLDAAMNNLGQALSNLNISSTDFVDAFKNDTELRKMLVGATDFDYDKVAKIVTFKNALGAAFVSVQLTVGSDGIVTKKVVL